MYIFNKSSSKNLSDLIPEGYVDIHSHLLPAIDDGAKNVQETLNFLRQLSDYGFDKFITTPHIMPGVWNNTSHGIVAKEQELKSFLKQEPCSYPIKAAAEYYIDEHFMQLIKSGELLTLDDKHVLIEFSYINAPLIIYDVIFELKLSGYIPVVAHPERYRYYSFKNGDYHNLKKAGCKFQLNLLSLTGYYGKSVYETSKQLIENNMINFTGSDVHNESQISAFKQKVLLKDINLLKTILDNNLFFAG